MLYDFNVFLWEELHIILIPYLIRKSFKIYYVQDTS